MDLIASEYLSGHTDTIVLIILLEKDYYGFDLFKKINHLTHNMFDVKETTLYSCLKRLESLSYVTSYWGNDYEKARRRYYHITNTGKKILESKVVNWLHTFEILTDIYGGLEYDKDIY